MLKVLLHIYAKEGVAGFYKGFGATMLNTFSQREYFSVASTVSVN